jgi:hypothetical protein
MEGGTTMTIDVLSFVLGMGFMIVLGVVVLWLLSLVFEMTKAKEPPTRPDRPPGGEHD